MWLSSIVLSMLVAVFLVLLSCLVLPNLVIVLLVLIVLSYSAYVGDCISCTDCLILFCLCWWLYFLSWLSCFVLRMLVIVFLVLIVLSCSAYVGDCISCPDCLVLWCLCWWLYFLSWLLAILLLWLSYLVWPYCWIIHSRLFVITEISNLVCTTRLWNNLHQVAHNRKIRKSNNLEEFGCNKTKRLKYDSKIRQKLIVLSWTYCTYMCCPDDFQLSCNVFFDFVLF